MTTEDAATRRGATRDAEVTAAESPSGRRGPASDAQDTVVDSPTGRRGGAAGPGVAGGGGHDARYALGRELASGGMGRIFEARDLRLERAVAIKQLRAASLDLRARFEREARITASLQHPSIVQVIDVGTWPDGEPYFAMALVEGAPLDAVLARADTLAARVAHLPHVIAVAEAIAYAHSRQIIHRDLKPANVLVGRFGQTVVIDWGLAKELAAGDDGDAPDAGPYRREGEVAGETAVGDVMGTPGYMAPEQARGEPVDARADVYALGSMLYQLVVGAPPYRAGESRAVLAALLSGPPAPIAARVAGVPADLVAIIEKAMARRPEERYADARGLAEDLQRFQAGQLVGARPYTARELARRWVRRHRVPVAIGAVALVASVALGGAGLYGVLRERTRTAEASALAARGRAEVEDLLGFMLGDLHDKLRALGRLDLLRAVTQKAASYYAERGQGGGEDQARRARALVEIGGVLMDQGDLPGARASREAALGLAEGLAAAAPADPVRQRELMVAARALGDVLLEQRELDAALAMARRAAALAARLGAPGDQLEVAATHARLSQVLAARGDAAGAVAELRLARGLLEGRGEPRARAALATARKATGDLLVFDLGDIDGGLAELRAAAALWTALAADAPGDRGYRRELAAVRTSHGAALQQRGALAESLAEFQAALAIETELTTMDPTNVIWQRDVAISDQWISASRRLAGDLSGAVEAQRATVAIVDRLVTSDPSNLRLLSDLAEGRLRLGVLLAKQGDLAGARAQFEAELAAAERAVAAAPADARAMRQLTSALVTVGKSQRVQGDAPRARATFARAVANAEAQVARDPRGDAARRDLSLALESLGDVQLELGDRAGALDAARRTLAIGRELAAKSPTDVSARRDVMMSLEKLGDTLMAGGEAAQALGHYREELALARENAAKDATNLRAKDDVAYCQMRVGEALLAAGDARAAVAELRESLALRAALVEASPKDLDVQEAHAEALANLGLALRAVGGAAAGEAAQVLRRAVAAREGLVAASPGDASRARALAELRAKVAAAR